MSDLLGSNIELRFREANLTRSICGMIYNIEQSDKHTSLVTLQIAPRLWLLSLRSDCRIYQHKSVPDIIQDIMSRHRNVDFEIKLTHRYRAWDYCVQYRESDLAFLMRLIEHEGITLWFDHRDGRDVAVFADTSVGFGSVPSTPRLPLIPPDSHGKASLTSDPHASSEISSWVSVAEFPSAAMALDSYDYTLPSKPLGVRAAVPTPLPNSHAECFDFDAVYSQEAEGRYYAAIRSEETASSTRSYKGQTPCRLLDAGLRFVLEDPALNLPPSWRCEYLIKSISIRCESESTRSGETSHSFECSFSSQPTENVFRPKRMTPWPRIIGPQYAVVTGPQGSEIHTDKLGRVKVKFRWDRHGPHDDGSSCWLRSTQAWAGKGWGGIQIPRVGQEVVVEFTDGDPNRPVITGRIYNGESMPPVSAAGRDRKKGEVNPEDIAQAAMQMTMRSNSLGGSGGHNEITMHDEGGSEKLFIRAQKDEVHLVQNDRQDNVGHDEIREVTNDRTRKVGNNESVEIAVDESRKVGSNQTINVGKNIKITAGDSITLECGMSKLTMNSSGVISLTGTMITVAGMANVNVAAPMTNIAGAAMLNLLGALTTVTGSTVNVTGKSLTSVSGGKLDLLAPDDDLIILGKKVQIN